MRQQRSIMVAILLAILLWLTGAAILSCSRSQDEERRKRAGEYVRQRNIAAAIEELEKLDAPTVDDHNWRGELLTQRGRPYFNDAAEAFRTALRMDGRNATALYDLGLLAFMRKEYVEAEAFARKALQAHPNAPHARNLLAGALKYQGKYGEAEELLVALEAEPTVATLAKGNLGELYLRQGKLDAAEKKLLEAIKAQPENFDWHRSLGDVYRSQGKRKQALREYRTALELLGGTVWADPGLIEGVRARIRELE